MEEVLDALHILHSFNTLVLIRKCDSSNIVPENGFVLPPNLMIEFPVARNMHNAAFS